MAEFVPDSSKLKINNNNLNMSIPQIYGLNEVISELRAIEPDSLRAMRKEVITELRPLYSAIKSNIPTSSPLKGFNHSGRTAWGGSVKVTGNISFRKRMGKTTLVSIRTTNAAVEISDMAGRAGKFDVGREGAMSGFSAPYMRNGREVRHRLNGQGQAMVNKLNSTSGERPSRFIYPVIERSRPLIVSRLQNILDKYSASVNRKLES